jgi:hypothetical protein
MLVAVKFAAKNFLCNFSGEGWVLEREIGMFNRRTPTGLDFA